MKLENLPWIKAEDREAVSLAAKYLPMRPVIIEAGVCDAEDTCRFKSIWPNCTVYGFEPHPELYEKAKKIIDTKISEENLSKTVHLYNGALSDKTGKQTFYMSSIAPACSSLLSDNMHNVIIPERISAVETKTDYSYRDNVIEVDCITLDDWYARMSVGSGNYRPDYIWLDTEGAELKILKSATSLLKFVKVISLEVNFQEFRKGSASFEELHTFLLSKDFHIQYIWGNADWQGVAIYVNSNLVYAQ